MRLAPSLGLWLAVVVALVVGVHGWLQLRTEEADLTTAARRELTLLTTAVRSGVENAIRDNQEPDIVVLLEQLELKDPAVDIFVFGLEGVLRGSSWGSGGNVAKARDIVRHTETSDVLRIEELPSGEFVATAPLRVGGSVRGRLVLLRPSNALLADLAAERHAIVLSFGLLIAALSLVIWAVVQLRVHRPLSRVIAGVRRVGGGDLSARINLTGRDEVAELAQEFDAMSEALEGARRQLVSETEAREKLEVDMQRANKLAIVGEVAATLAHEIGSPLQVLNGRARDLAVRADLPQDAKRSAAILVEQTDRVHHIVERLLDVARRKAPELEDLDIQESVQRMVELFSTQARRMGVHLEFESQKVPHLRGDPAQVQQVLLNLLQNALRASVGGGVVRITISPSSFRRPSDSKNEPSVAIAVDDTGSGIPEAVRNQIFDPFVTAWNDEPKSKGTGLGLAVVKSIVAEHGGIVSAETSCSGVGARFVVHLPVPASPLAAAVEAT
jgi:signal transduction histidine kinase